MACTWPCCILGINTLSAYIWFESPDMPCEKVARLHNSFVSLMSPVAGCTCFCCRSSTQQIDAILSVTWLPGDAGWRALVCLGPTLGSQLRMLTLLFVSSPCLVQTCGCQVPLRLRHCSTVFNTHTHTYTCTFTHSTFTHDSITHTHRHTDTHTHTYPIFTHLCLCTHSFHQQTLFFLHGSLSYTSLRYAFLAHTHTHRSSTISCLVPALPIPSSPFFGYLLEEVDMWSYPVL